MVSEIEVDMLSGSLPRPRSALISFASHQLMDPVAVRREKNLNNTRHGKSKT